MKRTTTLFRVLLFAFLLFGGAGLSQDKDPAARQLGLTPETGSLPAWTAPAPQAEVQLGEAVRKFQQGVMIVGEPKAGHGTAFVISRSHRLLVTNAHVADIMAASGTMKAVVSGSPTMYKVERAWYHPGTVRRLGGAQSLLAQSQNPAQGSVFPFGPDVAVLQLTKDGPELPAEFVLATPAELTTLFAQPVGMLGFPGHDSHFPDEGDVPQPTYHPGVVSRLTDFRGKTSVKPERLQFVQHTASGWGGFSGSPIFLTNGHVIALHNMRRSAEDRGATTQISHGVRIDCLWELLVFHHLDDLIPLSVDKASLDVARFSKPDPELEKFQQVINLVQEADDLSSEGKHAEAVKKCNAAIAISPDYPLIYAVRMEAHSNYVFKYQNQISEQVMLQQLTLAYENAKKFAQLAPGNPRGVVRVALGLNNLAGAEYRQGREDEATVTRKQVIAMLDKALSIRDLDVAIRAEALSTRGTARGALMDYEGGLADHNQAIRLVPDPIYYENRAQFYEYTDREDLAEADRREAERLRKEAIRYGLATYVWKEYRSEDGGFRADFPGLPKLSTINSNSTHHHVISLIDTQDKTEFTVGFGEWSAETVQQRMTPEQLLERMHEQFTKQSRLVSQKKIRLNGYPGRELELERPNKNVMWVREYATERQFFVIGVERNAARLSARNATVARFLESFALLAGEQKSSEAGTGSGKEGKAVEPSGATRVRPGEFAITSVDFYLDERGTKPTIAGGKVGQRLYVRLKVVGFDRSQGRIDSVMNVQLLDATGKPLLPKAVQAEVLEDSLQVVKDAPFLSFSTDFPLAQEGEFVLRITVLDRIGNNVAKSETPLKVFAP